MSEARCRRCSECEGLSHHFIPNPDFGNGEPPDPEWDEGEGPEDPDYAFVCKHCPAVGGECGRCDGSGWLVREVTILTPDGREYPDETEEECPDCDGTGVIEGLAFTGWRAEGGGA